MVRLIHAEEMPSSTLAPGIISLSERRRRAQRMDGKQPERRRRTEPRYAQISRLRALPEGAAPAKTMQALAREFHDGVLQNLVFLDLELAALRAEKEATQVAARLPTLQQVVQESITDLRNTLGEMRTQRQACGCLQEVLHEQVRSFNTLNRAGVTLVMRNCPQPLSAPAPIGHDIDLIVHEALCNAWRHSGAASIAVALCGEESGVKVQVSDNGRGFDGSLQRPGHFGLRSMHERAEEVGGQLEIVSSPGHGTTVKLFVPARLLSLSAA